MNARSTFREKIDTTLKLDLLAIQVVMAAFFCIAGAVGAVYVLCFDSENRTSILVAYFFLAGVALTSLNLLGIGVLLGFATLRTLTQSLVREADGLVMKRPSGRSIFKWTELEAIRTYSMDPVVPNWFGLGAIYDVVTFEFANGSTISIGPETRTRYRLVSFATRMMLKARVAYDLNRINDGKTVGFRSIIASSTGLHRGNRTLRWEAINSARLCERGSLLKVSGSSEIFSLTVGKTDNVALLLCLIGLKCDATLVGLPGKCAELIHKYFPSIKIIERTAVSEVNGQDDGSS